MRLLAGAKRFLSDRLVDLACSNLSNYARVRSVIQDMERQIRMRQHNAESELIATLVADLAVCGGPFIGMRYPRRISAGSVFTAKMLGTYEKELWPWWEEVKRAGYSDVIDVGAAEGYYAVGVARLLPNAHIWAFEIDPRAREYLAEIACFNDVRDRIEIRDRCTPDWLASFQSVGARTLIICDCEGCEAELLGGPFIGHAGRYDMIVETHDMKVPGIFQELRARFERSHETSVVQARARTIDDFPFRTALNRFTIEWGMYESRTHDQRWLFLRSRE